MNTFIKDMKATQEVPGPDEVCMHDIIMHLTDTAEYWIEHGKEEFANGLLNAAWLVYTDHISQFGFNYPDSEEAVKSYLQRVESLLGQTYITEGLNKMNASH